MIYQKTFWPQPQGRGVSCWTVCDLHYKIKLYLTRKLRAMGPDFFEKSWSRTLRSICSHLRWPLQKSRGNISNTHSRISVCLCNRAILRTCHRKTRVQKIPSLWGWSGRKPGRGARTTGASAGEYRRLQINSNSKHNVNAHGATIPSCYGRHR